MKKTTLKDFCRMIFGCYTPTHYSNATKRETEVAGLIAAGWSNKEVASHLKISIKTVEKHRTAVHKKNNLANTADLTRWALAHGYAKNEFLENEKKSFSKSKKLI